MKARICWPHSNAFSSTRDCGQRRRDFPVVGLPRGCELSTGWRDNQQLDSQLRFQLADVLANDGVVDPQFLARTPVAAEPGGRFERP